MLNGTGQVPPLRQPPEGGPRTQPQAFVPVALIAPAMRPKRRHWAVAAIRSACRLVFGVLCAYVGLVTFCLTFHYLPLPR